MGVGVGEGEGVWVWVWVWVRVRVWVPSSVHEKARALLLWGFMVHKCGCVQENVHGRQSLHVLCTYVVRARPRAACVRSPRASVRVTCRMGL